MISSGNGIELFTVRLLLFDYGLWVCPYECDFSVASHGDEEVCAIVRECEVGTVSAVLQQLQCVLKLHSIKGNDVLHTHIVTTMIDLLKLLPHTQSRHSALLHCRHSLTPLPTLTNVPTLC